MGKTYASGRLAYLSVVDCQTFLSFHLILLLISKNVIYCTNSSTMWKNIHNYINKGDFKKVQHEIWNLQMVGTYIYISSRLTWLCAPQRQLAQQSCWWRNQVRLLETQPNVLNLNLTSKSILPHFGKVPNSWLASTTVI